MNNVVPSAKLFKNRPKNHLCQIDMPPEPNVMLLKGLSVQHHHLSTVYPFFRGMGILPMPTFSVIPKRSEESRFFTYFLVPWLCLGTHNREAPASLLKIL